MVLPIWITGDKDLILGLCDHLLDVMNSLAWVVFGLICVWPDFLFEVEESVLGGFFSVEIFIRTQRFQNGEDFGSNFLADGFEVVY